MSWRAFIIGLAGVALIAAVAPYNDWVAGNTYLTGCHFPPGPFFLLLILTVGLNVLIKLVRKAWALRRAELMVVWTMMLVASTVPSSGLMRFLFSLPAAPAYYARSADLPNQDRLLEALPDELVPTKDPDSVLINRFFEGQRSGEDVRIYLGRWLPSIGRWVAFALLFYLAIFCLGGMLRRQWVDVERLIFPVARVPLELTDESGARGLLPPLFGHKPFVAGLVVILGFAFLRVVPAMFGGSPWELSWPLMPVLGGTPLGNSSIDAATIYPLVIGIAFLVPADVSLSVWFFYLLTRLELQFSFWIGRPIQGGTYGAFMAWQQTGAFLVFAGMIFWAARKHLARLVKKALVFEEGEADADEPISYRVSFWGFVLAFVGLVTWYTLYGMRVYTAVAMLLLVLCIALIHARLVSQGGIFFTQQTWSPYKFLHGISGGQAFGPAGAVVAGLQTAIFVQDSREILSGHAMNALRISSVFKRHRRWFLPVMMTAIVVAIGVSGYFMLRAYYQVGGVNFSNTYGTISLPKGTMNFAGRMIADPSGSAEAHWWAFSIGTVIMFFVTFMRARFYWWPVHSLGFLISSTYPAGRVYFSFLLAWFIKMFVMKFGGGSMLRKARYFFLGVIIGEAAAIGITAAIALFADLQVGFLFLPT